MKKVRMTAILLSMMMVFAISPLTAVATINGYSFELEADATNNTVNLTEGDILTDKCGVGAIAERGYGAVVTAGNVLASTVGVKAWSYNQGISEITAGRVTGDNYTDCAVGAEAYSSGNSRVTVDSVDVGMIREDNNHRSAVDAFADSGGRAKIAVVDNIDVTTEATGAYLSAIKAFS